jgi:hypothetical protein
MRKYFGLLVVVMRSGAREGSRGIFNNRPAKRQIKAAPANK